MARRIEIDWVIVRVETIKKLQVAALLFAVCGVLLFFAYRSLHKPPAARAASEISKAEKARAKIDEEKLPEGWREELSQADDQLDKAKDAYASENWQEAIRLARSARNRYETLAGAPPDQMTGVAQVVVREGKVFVQRAGEASWRAAQRGMPLFAGDFIKTGDSGTAEILFSDGTVYKVGPGSVLEIAKRVGRHGTDVKMLTGRVDVRTAESTAKLKAHRVTAKVGQESTVAVGVVAGKRATVSAFRGRAEVVGLGGKRVELEERERVVADADGKLGSKEKLPAPPTLLDPPNDATFDMAKGSTIVLRWSVPDDAGGSHLQVAESRSFIPAAIDVDAKRQKSSAKLRALRPGVYYWRVATLSRSGAPSQWSSVRRFRVIHSGGAGEVVEMVPAKLELKPIKQLGHFFIVEGKTDPGSEVTINGEPVEVDGEGSFSKTVEVHQVGENELIIQVTSPTGAKLERRERVFVEVY